MLLQMFVALSMVILTLVVHVTGLGGLLALMSRQGRRPPVGKEHLASAVLILLIVHALFFLHMFAVFAYAVLYVAVGAMPDFQDAIRFSAGAYATVGSDLLVTPAWRLVAAIEAANGVFLLGWSTAFFVTILDRIRLIADAWLRR
ncbi:MAG TPA: hypothetical protein VHY34_06775 [Caulobacteraceae bacterium]|jgi:hypothetical protein|nr:hypothetical protein [Caulobacteraceae bacterium]